MEAVHRQTHMQAELPRYIKERSENVLKLHLQVCRCTCEQTHIQEFAWEERLEVSLRWWSSGVVHLAFWRQYVSETWGSPVQLSWPGRELQAPTCQYFPGTDNASPHFHAWLSKNVGVWIKLGSLCLSYLPSPGSTLFCNRLPSKVSQLSLACYVGLLLYFYL